MTCALTPRPPPTPAPPPRSLLADLFTARHIVEAAPPILIAANKADVAGARTPAALRTMLEAEM